MSLDRNISGFFWSAPIMLRMSYVCYDRLGPAAIIPVLEILQKSYIWVVSGNNIWKVTERLFTVCCGNRQQYLKGRRKAIHSLLWWQATIIERSQKGYSQFIVMIGHDFWNVTERLFNSLLWWQATIFETAQNGYSQFIVMTGYNIWKVRERLFTVCCGDRAQYLKDQRKFIDSLLWWQTIIFERLKKGYSQFVVETDHNIWKVT